MFLELLNASKASATGPLSLPLGHHHLQELLVVYESILVLVDLAYQLVHLLVRHRLVLALQAEPQLLRRDGARVVLVEILKGLLDLLLLRVILGVHARCDELRVVDDAVVVRVDDFHGLLDVVHGELDLRH